MSEEEHSASQVFFLLQLFAFPSFCPFSFFFFFFFFSFLSFIPCSYILVLHATYRIGCLFPWEGYVWRQMEQEDFSRSLKSTLWGPYIMCTGAWGAVYHYPFSSIPGKNGVSFLHKWTISSLCTDITVWAGLGEFTYKVSLWFEAPERERGPCQSSSYDICSTTQPAYCPQGRKFWTMDTVTESYCFAEPPSVSLWFPSIASVFCSWSIIRWMSMVTEVSWWAKTPCTRMVHEWISSPN